MTSQPGFLLFEAAIACLMLMVLTSIFMSGYVQLVFQQQHAHERLHALQVLTAYCDHMLAGEVACQSHEIIFEGYRLKIVVSALAVGYAKISAEVMGKNKSISLLTGMLT